MNLLRGRVSDWVEALHDEVTAYVTGLDGAGRFREDRWDRPGGGGGVARVMSGGAVFEKAGVNRSAVSGELAPDVAQRLGIRAPSGPTAFFAAGMSVVLHPLSPMIPTVHLNVRYFEIAEPGGGLADRWFAGGTDLTPTYPFAEDAAGWHQALRAICDRHGPSLYPRFKAWCDEYFVNVHRNHEPRGVGGIFFDNLRGEGEGEIDAIFNFVADVGRALPAAYGPIVEQRRKLVFGARERDFQLARRGRYVEFNLIHDRGTLFGLHTNARIDSVLMSLPPVAAWEYAPVYAPGSFEAELLAMLEPKDWAGGGV